MNNSRLINSEHTKRNSLEGNSQTNILRPPSVDMNSDMNEATVSAIARQTHANHDTVHSVRSTKMSQHHVSRHTETHDKINL